MRLKSCRKKEGSRVRDAVHCRIGVARAIAGTAAGLANAGPQTHRRSNDQTGDQRKNQDGFSATLTEGILAELALDGILGFALL